MLWELYPNHELLLEAKFVGSDSGWQPAAGWVRKPLHSREGSNITLARPDGSLVSTDGPYTNRLQVDQRLGPAVNFQDASGTARWSLSRAWP